MTYVSGPVNRTVPTRAQDSGSRSRQSGGSKSVRLKAYGPTGRPSPAFVPLRPGDREWQAFQEMFVASRPKFVRMAYSILRNREDAEDAVQDAFLSGYLHSRAFEGRSALTTWFARIVLNASFMIRRKRKSSHSGFSPESSAYDDISRLERIPAQETDPEITCAAEETLALIHALLEKMNPMLRQAFTMTYFEEMATAEACAALGVSGETFKSRLFRARRHLTEQVRHSLIAPVRRLPQPAFIDLQTVSRNRVSPQWAASIMYLLQGH